MRAGHRYDRNVAAPSSGGVAICEILGIVGPAGGGALRDAANAHLEIEAERRAFADRNTALGDPDFVHAPVAQLLNPAYLARQRASITPTAATSSSEIPDSAAMKDTTRRTSASSTPPVTRSTSPTR